VTFRHLYSSGLNCDASVISSDRRYPRFVSGDLKLEKGLLTPTSIVEKKYLDMKASKKIIGTRGSALALWQANWTRESLQNAHPGLRVEITVIKTTGDKILDSSLSEIGTKGIFTTEIEEKLLAGSIDLAVHSHKDLPTESPKGLMIAAIPPREDAADAIVFRNSVKAVSQDHPLDALDQGAKVLTGSLRRSAQLLNLRPDLQTIDVRGNIQTRLKKLEESDADALIMASAALQRLAISDQNAYRLSPDTFVPACAQGALAIQIRDDDNQTRSLVNVLDDSPTRTCVTAERTLLATLEGGCQIPIGAFAQIEKEKLNLIAIVASLDGTKIIRDQLSGPVDDPITLGQRLAQRLLDAGAEKILKLIRN
jgi:hydroxymethylbilane synthase